jgi:hypothetical protein
MRNILLLATGVLLAVGCQDSDQSIIDKQSNNAPVANAGDNITQDADSPIALNGAGSYDPDGDDLIYHWAFDTAPVGSVFGGDTWTMVNNNTVEPTTSFVPDAPGTYVVSLWVEDPFGAQSTADYVVVTVLEGMAPVADAGPELNGAVGDLMTLDGTRSYDPHSRPLTYQWTFASLPSGSGLTAVDDPVGDVTTFTPDVGGVYVAALVVHNGVTTSPPDTAIVRIASDVPTAPTAVTGDPITAEDCTAVPLDGSGSYDPNGEPLSYQWSLVSLPAQSQANNASFADTTAAITTFYPDVAGEYMFGLTVSDGNAWSDVSLQTLTAEERSYNSPPAIEAGEDQAIDGGEAECSESGYTYSCDECAEQIVPLGADATATDADGDPIVISWEVLSGYAVITDPSALNTVVTLSESEPEEPGACTETVYEFQLTVSDCFGDVVTDIVTYTVTCCGIEETTGTTTTSTGTP